MYEVIYNRIISNLLLWAPSAPNATKQPPQQSNIDTTNPFHNINMTDSGSIPFSMAKSNIFFGKYTLLSFLHVPAIMKKKYCLFITQIRAPATTPIQTQIPKTFFIPPIMTIVNVLHKPHRRPIQVQS